MIAKTVRRAAVVVAAAALLAAGSVQPAHAAYEELGRKCYGAQVVFCVWFEYDKATRDMRARATAADTVDGVEYDVAVSNVYLEVLDDGAWRKSANTENTDYDGWHPTSDEAIGARVTCNPAGYIFAVRASALFKSKVPEHTTSDVSVRRTSGELIITCGR